LEKNFLSALEKEYGKNSHRYCLLSLEVASVFKAVNKKEKAIEIMKHAFETLIPTFDSLSNSDSVPTEQIKPLISCCLQLNHALSDLECIPYIERVYNLLEWWCNKDSDSDDAIDLFRLWISHMMHMYRKCGFWMKTEKVYLAFMSNQNKKHIEGGIEVQDIVENYVSALHQQGKTEEAIKIIEKFLEEVKENNNEKIESAFEWGLNRMSKFYFYLDDFKNSQRCLLELRKFCEVHSINKYGTLHVPLSSFVELMTVHVELGIEEYFTELENQLKTMDSDIGSNLYGNNSLVRSKYLITQETLITNHYHLVYKVCIMRPRRPEGEFEKSEDDLERKLTKFYIEVFFENPCKTEAPLFLAKEIDHYDFEVDSPNFTVTAQPYHWYTTKMYLYSDKTKEKLIGKHFQMVFLEAAAMQRRRR